MQTDLLNKLTTPGISDKPYHCVYDIQTYDNRAPMNMQCKYDVN